MPDKLIRATMWQFTGTIHITILVICVTAVVQSEHLTGKALNTVKNKALIVEKSYSLITTSMKSAHMYYAK
jgi:hypothetical protein